MKDGESKSKEKDSAYIMESDESDTLISPWLSLTSQGY